MSASPDPAEPRDEAHFHRCPPDPSCSYCNPSLKDESEPLDWSFLDAVYCISLKGRDDRVTDASAQFHKVGLCQQVTFYRPEKHPRKGVIGSWESHRSVGMHALGRGCEKTLIFEDDVSFTRRIRPRTLRSIERALDRLAADWMIFFLGHSPLSAYFVRWNVLRTSSLCAHAYIVSPRMLRWLRDHPWGTPGVEKRRVFGKGLDHAYARLPGTYALFPMIAGQAVSKSDNFNFVAPALKPGKTRKKRKLKHLVTHSRHRELLLAKSMRPAEIIVVLLSPAFFLAEMARRLRTRFVSRDPALEE